MKAEGLVALAALLCAPCAHGAERAFVLVTNDNDFWAFQGQDVGYSNGLEVDLRRPMPGYWFDRVLVGGSLGQALYTPGHLRETRPEALRLDHPYVGWLWATGRLDAWWSRLRFSGEMRLGVVGPHALGEQTQTAWHSWNRAPRPRGWPVLQVGDESDMALRLGAGGDLLGLDVAAVRRGLLGARLAAEVSCEVGSLRGFCQASPWVRVGLVRGDRTVPLLAAPVAPAFVGDDGRRPEELFFFAGFTDHRGWRDRVLEGDVCDAAGRCETSWVRVHRRVSEWQVGVGATAWGWSLSFAYRDRSPELRSPSWLARSQRYGHLTLGLAW